MVRIDRVEEICSVFFAPGREISHMAMAARRHTNVQTGGQSI